MTIADIVRPLALRGLRPVLIAKRTGLRAETVSRTMSRLRASGVPIKVHPPGRLKGPMGARLTESARRALTQAAAARGVSLGMLKRQLLETIATDGMVDAVLDDGDAG